VIFKKILRRPTDFFSLLCEQADLIAMSVHALATYAECLCPADAETVKSLEKQGDRVRFGLIQNLRDTFITPYDREDIYALSKALDDILDYYKVTVKEMEIYQIGSTEELCGFVAVLEMASKKILDAVRNMEKSPEEAMKNALAAKKCENKVESIYRHSVAALLNSEDIRYIIKMRELYRHLSNCADRIDECADLICNILIKEIS